MTDVEIDERSIERARRLLWKIECERQDWEASLKHAMANAALKIEDAAEHIAKHGIGSPRLRALLTACAERRITEWWIGYARYCCERKMLMRKNKEQRE